MQEVPSVRKVLYGNPSPTSTPRDKRRLNPNFTFEICNLSGDYFRSSSCRKDWKVCTRYGRRSSIVYRFTSIGKSDLKCKRRKPRLTARLPNPREFYRSSLIIRQSQKMNGFVFDWWHLQSHEFKSRANFEQTGIESNLLAKPMNTSKRSVFRRSSTLLNLRLCL